MAARKQKPTKHTKSKPILNLPVALLILTAVVLLGLVIKVSISRAGRSQSNSDQLSPADSDQRWAYVMTDLVGQTRHFKGSPDASVTILEFSDFQ